MIKSEDISSSISNLADKVSKYHSRLMTVERDFQKHIEECTCDHAKNHKEIGEVKSERTRRYIEELNRKENAKVK